MYVQRNIEARSCKRYLSSKAINVTYSECVFLALGIQCEMRMHRIVICHWNFSLTILPAALWLWD
jgi:hypothetical protein